MSHSRQHDTRILPYLKVSFPDIHIPRPKCFRNNTYSYIYRTRSAPNGRDQKWDVVPDVMSGNIACDVSCDIVSCDVSCDIVSCDVSCDIVD